jgi:hypothetical protein
VTLADALQSKAPSAILRCTDTGSVAILAGMPTYVFRSEKEPEWFAQARDEHGARLPRDLGPWWPSAGTEMVVANPLERQRRERVMKRDGFYLFRLPSTG